MRHVRVLTKQSPRQAAFWQEVVCNIAQGVNAFIGILGGTLPVTQYVEDKCDIPVPNTEGTTPDSVDV